MSVFRSINMSVNVELVKMRTIFELTGGKSVRLPEKILSTVFSSIMTEWFDKLLLTKHLGTGSS